MTEETVTITKEEYDQLVKDQRLLNHLIQNGVDNWEWFSYPEEINE
jgi:hypothetical protein